MAFSNKIETLKLIERAQKGDVNARNRAVELNLGLVHTRALKWNKNLRTLTHEDIVQEGTIGLIRAVEKFDPSKSSFSHYAVQWIDHSIGRAISNTDRAVRIPVHWEGDYIKTWKAELELTHELGHTPSIEEIAERSGLDIERVEILRDSVAATVSLDRPISEDGEGTLADIYLGSYEDEVNEGHMDIRDVLAELSPEDQTILRMRFGIDRPEATVQEIADAVGGSRNGIQIRIDKLLPYLRQRLDGIDLEPLPARQAGGHSKLSADSVRDFRRAHTNGASVTDLSKQYGVSRKTIEDAVKYRTWKHVT